MSEVNKGGRPPKFETVEELEKLIDAYFESLKAIDCETGEEYEKKPKITGIALFLGFESRQSFYDYEKKDAFTYTIRRARLRVELGYEESLDTKYSNGAQFALKNLGWKDQTQQEVTATIKDATKLSDKELDNELDAYEDE